MKSKLVLCSLVLGCSMGLMAQQSSAPGSHSSTTPPTFPQDQSQMGSQSGQLGSNSNATRDQTSQSSSQTGQMGPGSNSGQHQKVEGCLSGTDGNFTLTDKAGTTYQLQGENSELSKHVGQEVRVMGSESAAASASSSASSTSSEASSNPSSSSSGSGNTITVHKVKKISDTCSASQGAGNAPKQ